MGANAPSFPLTANEWAECTLFQSRGFFFNHEQELLVHSSKKKSFMCPNVDPTYKQSRPFKMNAPLLHDLIKFDGNMIGPTMRLIIFLINLKALINLSMGVVLLSIQTLYFNCTPLIFYLYTPNSIHLINLNH